MAASAAPPWLLDADLAAPKYNEAVAVAAEKCGEDTKGQTCYICTQALHWKTKEGLVRMCACRGTAGFAHVSCLAEQAKILFAEAEENNLGFKVKCERWMRWHSCGLCEQHYHGVVRCSLGWACWKTYVGRPETDQLRCLAMTQLGNGLAAGDQYEDELTVREAELSTLLRIGAPEEHILVAQGNLANTYDVVGRYEQALKMRRDVYSGRLKLFGEESPYTLQAAINYAISLVNLRRDEEAKALLRKTIPVARRVLGESDQLTLRMRNLYAKALCRDDSATLGDLREAVTMLEEADRTARRVLGGAHPLTVEIEGTLRASRAVLRPHEGDVESIREAVEAMAPGDA